MVFFQPPGKVKSSENFKNFVLICSFLCVVYLVCTFVLVPSTKLLHVSVSLQDVSSPTSLEHIVFGIASSEKSWAKRKEYVKLWWRPSRMRGCVFLDRDGVKQDDNDTDSLPPVCISGDTSSFRYTYRGGNPSAIRIARVVSEVVSLNHSNVRWFVFGDDDTVFFPDNLAKTLSKYDHGLWYYIGTNSEDLVQNNFFSFEMAFGGAGFAISYPLAKALAKVFDSCLHRYPHLYGSDGRVHACLSELGVSLTHEPGFHQMDIRGNVFGLLAAHPVRPLVSLHHMEVFDPIFPNMTTKKALEHLYKAASIDPHRILQQTVCYDRWFSWTISVSWGYAVQIHGNHLLLPDALRAQESYSPWRKSKKDIPYGFDSRGYHPDPCRRQTVFYMDRVSSSHRDGITSIYRKLTTDNCTFDKASPRNLDEIRVFTQKLDLDSKELLAPRRHCCDVLPSSIDKALEIGIRECKEEELVYMH
nr:uncharacterized protein LOC109156140 isoform X1 [Ipomoea batatas]